MPKNKVQFNLKNVHYAPMTDTTTPAWDTPVPVPGAVSLALEQQGSVSPFHADGIVYYQSASNSGYSGDLEMALFPDQMLEDIWGMIPHRYGQCPHRKRQCPGQILCAALPDRRRCHPAVLSSLQLHWHPSGHRQQDQHRYGGAPDPEDHHLGGAAAGRQGDGKDHRHHHRGGAHGLVHQGLRGGKGVNGQDHHHSGQAGGLSCHRPDPKALPAPDGPGYYPDLNQLRRSFSKAASLSKDATAEEREEAQLSMLDLEIFENIAWLMARQYDPHRPGQPGGVAGGLFHVLHLHDHAGDPGTLERQPAHYRKA